MITARHSTFRRTVWFWLCLAKAAAAICAGEMTLTSFHLQDGRVVPEHELPQSARTNQVFRAITGPEWPQGFVPLFQVGSKGKLLLRRLPPKGQEGITEPLCFILPMEGEAGVTNIAGRWEVRASREGQNTIFFGWEFSAQTNKLAGRFGQESDYRFAFVTSASFGGDRLQLAIDYVQDKYAVEGVFKDGKLSGTWRRTDDFENGTWQGERPEMPRLPELPKETLILQEDFTVQRSASGGLGRVWK